MDKLERYRQMILETLRPLADVRFADPNITNEAVFDRERDYYSIIWNAEEEASNRGL